MESKEIVEKKPATEISNALSSVRDANSRTIFKDHILTCQFFREYTGIPLFENITPEDIEDVTDIYQAYLGVEFETDTVKRVRIKQDGTTNEIVIPLIEHKSYVDYDVAMQVLRYMGVIWHEYARQENEKHDGISRTKAFRYPLIIPIVYYEGKKRWCSSRKLSDRISIVKGMEEYIPEFRYYLVDLSEYTNEDLQEHSDEMSLVMMINKIQTAEDFSEFLKVPKDYVEKIYQQAPGVIQEVVKKILWSLFIKMKQTTEEASANMKVLEADGMGKLFENMEEMDIHAEREKTKIAREQLKAVKKEMEETEAAKREAEAAKLKAEAAKQEAEAAKQVAEAAKQEAEAAKQVAEAEKKAAEKKADIATFALENAIMQTILQNRNANNTKEKTLENLQKIFQLDKDTAQEKFVKYWK